jgi:hypothetical protein
MLRSFLFLCAALMAFGADDPWAKLKELKTGTELRVYKVGAAQPLLVQMGDLTDDNLVVIDKKKETAIPRDQIERVDSRPSGKSRVTKETTSKDGMGPDGHTTSTSSGLSIGSRPDFETIYRRPASPPKK